MAMTGTSIRPRGEGDLLLLAPCLPCPSERGHRLRWYQLLRFLARSHRVHLGCFLDPDRDRAQLGHIKALCYETCFVEARPASGAHALRALGAPAPIAPGRGRSETLAGWVARLQRRVPLFAALACGARMASHLPSAPACLRLIDFPELESDRRRRAAAGMRWPLGPLRQREAARQLELERAGARDCEHLLFASSAQAALFAERAPESAHKAIILGNGVDADHFSPHIVQRDPFPAASRTLVMPAAMDDPVNAAAAAWFAHEVFAPLRASEPALRLSLVGARPGPRVRALEKIEGVAVVGAVADLRPWLAHAALVVAPQQAAHGAPPRLLEAMAMQAPVVASPQALAGLDLSPNGELLVADGAGDFITAVRAALAAPQRDTLARAARARVMRERGWHTSLAPLATLLDGGQPRRASAS
jgi:sugar transferase (PEP-CTERM/EpsH1 system associated)